VDSYNSMREGAREQGKGFAVVAEEVRTLAESAAKAAAMTRESFHGLTGSIENVGACISRIDEAVGKVEDVAQETSSASEEVSASARESAATSHHITVSCEQLAATARQPEEVVARVSL
jgi:methyl-accepting chemotaxis protein